MNKAEAIKIMESIRKECSKHEDCKGCPFEIIYADGEDECALDLTCNQCENPCGVNYKKIMSEGEEDE